MRVALVFALLCGACAGHLHRDALPDECPGPDKAWDRFANQWRKLTSTYRLITVTTSQGGRPSIERGTLTLVLADSAARYYRRSPTNPHSAMGDRPIVGIYVPDNPAAGSRPDSAEFENGLLYIGCRRCMDGDPLVYDVGWLGETGFGGMWRDYQSGIVRDIDDRGRPAPDPAGHFCAMKAAATEAR